MNKKINQINFIRIIIVISSLTGILLILFGNDWFGTIITPDNFRIISDILQNILILQLILALFMPRTKILKISFGIGIFTMIYDFFLETAAVYLDWWYPLGGTQFPPLLVIPLEMILSFFIIGFSFSILLIFPEKIRNSNSRVINWVKPLFHKKYDLIWRILLVLINAIIGINGDYSAGPEIWIPGPN